MENYKVELRLIEAEYVIQLLDEASTSLDNRYQKLRDKYGIDFNYDGNYYVKQGTNTYFHMDKLTKNQQRELVFVNQLLTKHYAIRKAFRNCD